MEKQKIFYVLLTILLSIIAFIIVIALVFKTDRINEGKFRVTDVILTSSAELVDKTKENSAWTINVSQKNLLSILITAASDAEISKIYLSDMVVKGDNSIVFFMQGDETKLILNNIPQELDIEYTLDENNQIKLEMVALNENVLRNWLVPENIKEIICDGRIFKTAGISLNDIQFDLKFKLNIVDKLGKRSTLNVELELPKNELIENGADIRRLDRTEFKFKVN